MAKRKVETQPSMPAEGAEFNRIQPKDGIHCTYANHIEVGHTAFDLRILFGEILGVTRESHPPVVTVEQRSHVTLSWLQAKILAGLLTHLVQSFEAANGPLNVPNITNMPKSFEPFPEK